MNTQIQFETNGWRVLVVKVPQDTVSVEIYDKDSLACALLVFTPHEYFEPGLPSPIPIPEGNWKYHYTIDTMTEEQAKVLVKFVGLPWCAYKNYISVSNWFPYALSSFRTLLESHGINLNEKQVILIEEK